MAITAEESGSPDLPLKSNFVSGALTCLSKRGLEGRGRTTQPTLNTQHSLMASQRACCRLHRPPSAQETAPFQMGGSRILGWWQTLPHFVEAQARGVSQQAVCFPMSTYVKLKQMQQGPWLPPGLFPALGPQMESLAVSEETGVVPLLAPT